MYCGVCQSWESLAGCAPEATDYSQQTSDKDQHIVASLWEELAALCQHVGDLGCHVEDLIYDLLESLAAFKLS